MKAHLLFSSLLMAALALSPLVAQSKTSHHKHNQINTDEKSFPTGTFHEERVHDGYYDKDGVLQDNEIDTTDDVLVIKKMDDFRELASENGDVFLVYFVGAGVYGTHSYSCRFSGIFEQKTKKKELTLVDSYKKLNCPLKITGYDKGIGIYNSGEYPSCNEFCDNEMGGGINFGYIPLSKKVKRRHK